MGSPMGHLDWLGGPCNCLVRVGDSLGDPPDMALWDLGHRVAGRGLPTLTATVLPCRNSWACPLLVDTVLGHEETEKEA